MIGANRNIIHNAKTHGAMRLRVMTRRSHGTKCIARFTLGHGIDRAYDGACCAQYSLAGTGRHNRIGVEMAKTFTRHSRHYFFNKIAWVGASDLFGCCFGCIFAR